MTTATKTRYAAKSLNARIIAKANDLNLEGIEREMFIIIAQTSGNCVFRELANRFGMMPALTTLESLMARELVFQMYSSDRYYTVAIPA